jgi:dynein heavy chain
MHAYRWVCRSHKIEKLTLTSFGHRYFRAHIESALQDGRSLLIEDCGEKIDLILDNIFANTFIKTSGLI